MRRVKRIVIAFGISRYQWQGEMEARFGLSFVIFDRDYLFNCRRERGCINPWTTHSQFIVSHSLPSATNSTPRPCAAGSTSIAQAQCLSWMKPTMPPRRHHPPTPSTPSSLAGCANSPCSGAPPIPFGPLTQRSFEQFLRAPRDAGPPAFHPRRTDRDPRLLDQVIDPPAGRTGGSPGVSPLPKR